MRQNQSFVLNLASSTLARSNTLQTRYFVVYLRSGKTLRKLYLRDDFNEI